MTMTSPQAPPPQQQPPPAAPQPAVPPPGPGVVVPFAAPPRDEDKSRTVLWIVLASVLAIVLCGGGAIGVAAVTVWSSNELANQAKASAEDFLDDIVDAKYDSAYKSVCKPVRKKLPKAKFTRQWASEHVSDYKTKPIENSDDGNISVPADLTTENGHTAVKLVMAVDNKSMDMSVCGW